MDNQVDKAGARKRGAWFPNNSLATLVAAIGACQIGIANDRKTFVGADSSGAPFKALCGTATDDANFAFTSTIMQLPIPFTLAFGGQTTEGSKRIRVTTTGVFVESYESAVWVEMGAFT